MRIELHKRPKEEVERLEPNCLIKALEERRRRFIEGRPTEKDLKLHRLLAPKKCPINPTHHPLIGIYNLL